MEADLFNCTHREMLPLFQDLTQLQNDEIQMNSYLALKTAQHLYDLTNSVDELYGADILLISRVKIPFQIRSKSLESRSWSHSRSHFQAEK